MKTLFPEYNEKKPARAAILMSGSGSNAEALLRYTQEHSCAFSASLIVTDDPRSRAAEISKAFDLPLETADIRRFYADHGENSIRLDTPRRQALRQKWSGLLFEQIKQHGIDLILLAGFIPLTSLTEKYPCLNVHPGDLTITDADGRRPYAGLHYRPVEDAICDGQSGVRSSVILAQPYSGNGQEEMDSGPVIGISEKILLDISPALREELIGIRKQRPAGKVPDDPLRRLAGEYIEKMKVCGDHVVFPRAADDFARGRFACGEKGGLFFKENGDFRPVVSVEYSHGGAKPLERLIK